MQRIFTTEREKKTKQKNMYNRIKLRRLTIRWAIYNRMKSESLLKH